MSDYFVPVSYPHLRFALYLTLPLLTFFYINTDARPLRGQKAEAFAGFTLVRRVTDYDQAGNAYLVRTETLYVSSSGDWRYVAIFPHGQVIETIFLCNRGVYFSDQRNKQLVKIGDLRSGRSTPTTAERLKADPQFVRTEYVLDRLAYLHRRDTGYLEETYLAPELGPFPFKRVSYLDAYTLIEEPVSLTFGDPEPSQLRAVDYPLAEQEIVFDPKLSERIEEKPNPKYPPEAQAAGHSGEVVLQVIVDEMGRVIRVVALRNEPLLAEAAMEAAYRARFRPTMRDGKPVKVTGLIAYQFRSQ